MGKIVLIGLACALLTPRWPAQTPAKATGAGDAGPSMQSTVAFLHDIYKKQPPVQISRSEHVQDIVVDEPAPCRLRFTENDIQVFSLSAGGTRLRHRLRQTLFALDKSAPLSVLVLSGSGVASYFQPDAKRAMGVSYFLPLPVHEDQPVLDLPTTETTGLNGYVLTSSPTEVLFIAQDDNRYRLPASVPKATVTRNGLPTQMTSARPGDSVDYQPLNAKGKHNPVVAFTQAGNHEIVERYSELKLPVLGEEDTANRVAKAFIHAMALCHREEEPSPF